MQQQLNDGAIDASAVAQATTQLESARTQDTDIDVKRAQMQHAIATLIGEPASTFSLPAEWLAPVAPPAIPTGLPSQLLERRPDIAAAERRVAAANAQIGVAHAAFYPESDALGERGAGELVLRAVAERAEPVLVARLAARRHDVRRRAAQSDGAGATAQYNGTVADYRQSVLVAFQQVEDKLTMLSSLASEEQASSERRMRRSSR